MKLGGKCDKEEKQHTRQSGDSSITSPFTPKKGSIAQKEKFSLR
jgi:hypothetical protein